MRDMVEKIRAQEMSLRDAQLVRIKIHKLKPKLCLYYRNDLVKNFNIVFIGLRALMKKRKSHDQRIEVSSAF